MLKLAKVAPPEEPEIVPLVIQFIPPDFGGRVYDPADDPNLIMASDQFKIKMLEGLSFGEVGGITRITFAIWDIVNNRAAV